MALNHSPKIVTDGLVFAYDMANTKKSWKGMPTTNQFTLPTSDVNGFGVQNSTFTRVRTGNYGGYEITPTDYVWRYNVTGNDCPYHGWDIPTTAGAVVTFSFDYYVDPSTTNYPVTNYLANFENAGSGVGGSIGDPTPSIKGVWKRAYFSSTATATGNSRCLLYPGACGGRLGDAGFILYKNPQVEFNAPGSIPTPFVAGTRTVIQAIINQVYKGSLWAVPTKLVYNSDNTFSFNGTNSVLSPGDLSAAMHDATTGIGSFYTIELLFKPTEVVNYRNVFDGYGSGNYGPRLEMNSSGTLVWISGNSVGSYASYTVRASGLEVNVYHYVALTLNAGVFTTYYNGNLVASSSDVYPNDGDRLINVLIGRGFSTSSERWFKGDIPITRIYNRALSAAEVKQNFNALRGRYGI